MALQIFKNILRIKPTNVLMKRWESAQNKVSIYDPFLVAKKKDKMTYLEAIKLFETREKRRRGHVEFIYAALARMQEFEVHKDLEAYKAVLDVLPKGKLVSTNIFQSEFMHYPKQQQCALDLLEQMEDNKVIPDSEMEQMLLNIFGRRGFPLRKFWRMMYWMPKFKNLSPWHLPDELPNDTLELAKLAIQRITSVDPVTKVNVWQTEEIKASLDKTWIVSAQSPAQRILISQQPPKEPLVIRGPYEVYLKDQVVTYFILFGKTRPEFVDNSDLDDVSNLEKPPGIPGFIGSTKLPAIQSTVHEQDDGTIVAICATGSSSRDSLLSWIRLLEKHDNPILSTIPIIFTLTAPSTDVAIQETQPIQDDKRKSQTKQIID